jgi:hypothetical protein
MNKAKLKEICIDAFEEAEKESMERTKQYYVCQVAREMWLALGNPNSSDKLHTNLRDSLFVLIRESFDEMLEKQNDNQSSA